MSRGKQYDVFISYSRDDKKHAEDLSKRLDDLGFAAWFDRSNLAVGKDWENEIEIALDLSSVCVVLLGSSGNSPWANETSWAAIDSRLKRSHGDFRFIPVLLPGTQFEDSDSLPILRNEWLIPWMQTAFIRFEDSLNEDDKMHQLILRIRGVGCDHNVLLRNAKIQKFIRHRANNALSIDWKELNKQYLQNFRKVFADLLSDSCKYDHSDFLDETAQTNNSLLNFQKLSADYLRDENERSMELRFAVVWLLLCGLNSDHLWRDSSLPTEMCDTEFDEFNHLLQLWFQR